MLIAEFFSGGDSEVYDLWREVSCDRPACCPDHGKSAYQKYNLLILILSIFIIYFQPQFSYVTVAMKLHDIYYVISTFINFLWGQLL